MQNNKGFTGISVKQLSIIPSPINLQLCNMSSDGFTCNRCELVFKSSSELKMHNIILDKPVKCSMCNDHFSTSIGMKKHYGKVHAKYRPSRCNLCKKRFRNKYAAKRHLLQVHEEVSRISCAHCGKILYNKFSLSRHSQICK